MRTHPFAYVVGHVLQCALGPKALLALRASLRHTAMLSLICLVPATRCCPALARLLRASPDCVWVHALQGGKERGCQTLSSECQSPLDTQHEGTL